MSRILIAIALGVFAGCATTRPQLPDSSAFIDGIRSGRIDLERFDLAEAGYWTLPTEERALWLSPVREALFSNTLTSETCDPAEHRRFNAAIWLTVLMQSLDESTWTLNAGGLRARLRQLDDELTEAAAVNPLSTNPRIAEMQARIARDQGIRAFGLDARWSASLPEVANKNWFALKLGRMMAIDCDDTRWLQAQMREIGWFDIPTYGSDADKDAWLLVQHADRNKEFQRSTLAYLEALPPGKTDPRNLAYLTDRVANGEKRPQRFGTQGSCKPEGGWKPFEIEDPDRVDERRAKVGLPPLAAYIDSFPHEACPKPENQ